MAKAKFRTAYDHTTEDYVTPSGTKEVVEHREEIDKNGKRHLIKDRVIPWYDKIQASAESCEIQTILRRASEGDFNALNAVQGNYIDITGAPASLAEAQQFVIRAKQEFEKLPKDIKAKFDNNAEIYVAQYGTDSWTDAMGIKAEAIAKEEAEVHQKKVVENMEKAFENLAEKGAVKNE